MKRLASLVLFSVLPLAAQINTFSHDLLVKFTHLNPFERFPDGRPKVPEALMKRLEPCSSEEVWGTLRQSGYPNQWEGNWRILHPEKKLIGRVVTAQFMPVRPDVNDVINGDAKAAGMGTAQNQRVIDMLQPGDVIVVDLFGKIENGTFVGDNLATAVYVASKTGMIIDGAIRDLEGIEDESGIAWRKDLLRKIGYKR